MANYANLVRRDFLKNGREIVCFIDEYDDGRFITMTGKPSNRCGLSWTYNNRADAVATAVEFFTRMTLGAAAVKWVYKTRQSVVL